MANDRDQHAVDTIAAHVRFNRVPEGLVQPNHDDAWYSGDEYCLMWLTKRDPMCSDI